MDQLDRAPASVRARRSGFGISCGLSIRRAYRVPDPIGVDSTRACKCEGQLLRPQCFSWEALDVSCRSSLSSQKRRQQTKTAAVVGEAAAMAVIRRRPNTTSELRPSHTAPVMLLDFEAAPNPAGTTALEPRWEDKETLSCSIDLALRNKHYGAQFFNKTSGGSLPRLHLYKSSIINSGSEDERARALHSGVQSQGATCSRCSRR